MQAFSDPSLNFLFMAAIVLASFIICWRRSRKGGASGITSSGGVYEGGVSVKSILTQTTPEGERFDQVGRISGIGAIVGIFAAIFGMTSGMVLLPFPGVSIASLQDTSYVLSVTVFMGLLTLGLFLQMYGSKELRVRLGGQMGYVLHLATAFAAVLLLFFALNVEFPVYPQQIRDFITGLTLYLALFTIAFQLIPVLYTDASKSWIGSFAGIFNALFIPLLAVGFVLGPSIVTLAYLVLLIGQLFALLFWWSPLSSIREFARSSEWAKRAFGITGLLSFIIGSAAVLIGPIGLVGGAEVWHPFGVPSGGANAWLVFAFCAIQLYWVMLAPRLGAKELKAAHIGDDIIKGGSKGGMLLLAAVGVIATAFGGTLVLDPESWSFLISVAPIGVMFMMGAVYASTSDIVTGMPLVVASIAMLIHPFVISWLVILPWIAVLVTQTFLMIESSTRGLTSFSQGFLTVIVSMAASIVFLLFILGFFGTGPAAMWPTNRWFPITLFGDIDWTIQAYTVVALPMMMLLIRNVALAGYAHGRGYTGGELLMGMSVLFALIVPLIAGNVGIIHIASTGAALLMALYAISFVLVLSLNLNLASDVEETGHAFEGQLIRVSSIAGLVFGAVVAILVLGVFSGFPSPVEVSLVITILVTLITGLEVLSLLTWFLAGIRLGMMKEGFGLTRI